MMADIQFINGIKYINGISEGAQGIFSRGRVGTGKFNLLAKCTGCGVQDDAPEGWTFNNSGYDNWSAYCPKCLVKENQDA